MRTDNEIVELFFIRSDTAIEALSEKHGENLMNLSLRITENREDSEECLNDSYLRTWNSIPEAKPKNLFAYVGKILRNLSIDKVRSNKAKKRVTSESTLILHELEECIPSQQSVQDDFDYHELSRLINDFLRKEKEKDRIYFIERYWHNRKISEIALRHHSTVKQVEMSLYRLRKKLKEHLEEGGYEV